MLFINRFIKGIFIGAGAILPGISSGVLCVIFGIYNQLVNSVLGLFSNFKKNFIYLLPIFLGVVLGVIFLGKILIFLFDKYPIYIKFSFIGLILGSIPSFLGNIYSSQKNIDRKSNIFFTFFSFIIAIFLVYLEKYDILENSNIYSPTTFYLIFAGIIMSLGIVVPGVSSTILLMLMGIYSNYLSAISNFSLPFLIPLSIGVVIGGIVFLIALKYLMKNYYSQTFHFILGFTIGSIFVIYPGFIFDITHILAILLMLSCIYLTYFFTKQEEKSL